MKSLKGNFCSPQSWNVQFEPFVLFIVLTILLFFLYAPALNGPFLFDDTDNLERNKRIQITELSYPTLKDVLGQARPVVMLSFALDHYLHGLSSMWFRGMNLLIHICTAMLLYYLLQETTALLRTEGNTGNYKWLPVVATLLWAVHPLHVQSVTYIVQRMNSLAAFFYLLAILLYVRTRISKTVQKKILLSCSCLIASMLAIGSKPNAAILPFTFLLYEWFFFQKLNRKWLRSFLPAFIVVFVLFFIFSYFYMGGHPLLRLETWYARSDFTPAQRLMTESRVIFLYLFQIIFPHPARLNIDHDILLSFSLFSPPSTFFSLVGVVGLLGLSGITARRFPLLSFGIVWFFLNLLIESTIIPLDIMFDHRTYIPSMMLIAGLVYAVMFFCQSKRVFILTVIAVFCLNSIWTYQRNIVWSSGVTLWQDSVNKSPNKARPHESLAYYLEQDGQYEEALTHYQRAIELRPGDANTYNNIANCYTKMGKTELAVKYYEAAVKIRPDYWRAKINLSKVLAWQEKGKPINAVDHGRLANKLVAQGEMKQALDHYNRALEMEPNHVENLYNRSVLLLRTGQFAKAEEDLLEVVALRDNLAVAHNNLGVVRERQGKEKAAVTSYQQALQIDPLLQDAQENLDRMLR